MLALALILAVENHAREQTLLDGFREIKIAYFLEYTDATEFHPEFAFALRAVWEVCFPSGTSDGKDFEDFFGLPKE